MPVKEFETDMDENILQLMDKSANTNIPPEAGGEVIRTDALSAPPADVPAKSFTSLWENFLRELASIDPLATDWLAVEGYVEEIAKITQAKSQERDQILRRRELIERFTQKSADVWRLFPEQMRELAINPPQPQTADEFDDTQLENYAQFLTELSQALSRYTELSNAGRMPLSEEKRRLKLLLESVDEIESFVDGMAKIMLTDSPLYETENYEAREDPSALPEGEDDGQAGLFPGK
jgi:hypothetical protein